MPKSTNAATPRTIYLASVGRMPAVEARELTIGDTLMWNFGEKTLVTAVADVSPQFLLITETNARTGEESERRAKKTCLVARVARALPPLPALGCLPESADVPQVKAALRLLTIDGQPLAAFNDAHQVVSAGAYLDPRRKTGEVVLRFVTEHRPRPRELQIPSAERERITQEYADLFHTAGWTAEEFRESGRLTAVILTPPAPAAR